jgi:hypothetical protein
VSAGTEIASVPVHRVYEPYEVYEEA